MLIDGKNILEYINELIDEGYTEDEANETSYQMFRDVTREDYASVDDFNNNPYEY